MTKIQHLFLPCIFIILASSCNSSKNIAGSYRSNFAAANFFVTKIDLRKDSMFGYRLRGDVMGDTASGKYKVANRFLILNYEPGITDTAIFALTNFSYRPKLYYIGHTKLFETDTSGKIIRKEFGYSKKKRYILFGTHYYRHKYYLKRIS